MTNQTQTCRFCDSHDFAPKVKYGVRHYAHHRCYLDAGKKLADLRSWQVAQFPYNLLKRRNLLAEAERLTVNYDGADLSDSRVAQAMGETR